MSYTRQYTLWCEGVNCGQWVMLYVGTLSEARRRARKDGWKRARRATGEMLDLCPTCAKKRSEGVR